METYYRLSSITHIQITLKIHYFDLYTSIQLYDTGGQLAEFRVLWRSDLQTHVLFIRLNMTDVFGDFVYLYIICLNI